MEPLLVIGGFILLAIIFRLIAGGLDGGRVERYVRERGWELVDRSWEPFGPGWFGEKDSRIYQIVYRDREGNLHQAHVKTSMLSGVYLTNDHLIQDQSLPPRRLNPTWPKKTAAPPAHPGTGAKFPPTPEPLVRRSLGEGG
jgi:hypothetical protein